MTTEYLLRPNSGDGKVTFAIYGQNHTHWMGSNRALKNGEWSHIAVTCDGEQLNMYINGEQDANLSVPGIAFKNISKKLAIGRLGESNLEYFHGSMDDIRFHSRALSGPEIQNLYLYEKPVVSTVSVDEFSGNSRKIEANSASHTIMASNLEPPLPSLAIFLP